MIICFIRKNNIIKSLMIIAILSDLIIFLSQQLFQLEKRINSYLLHELFFWKTQLFFL